MIAKGRMVALVLVALAVALTGCVGQRAAVNVGWTVAAEKDGTLYAAMANGVMLALDATQNGTLVWQYPATQARSAVGCSFARTSDENTETALDAVFGQPLVLDDVVIVGSYDGKLHAFGRTSGKPEWVYATEQAIVGGAAEADGILYFGSSDGKVYAIDAATQKDVWAQPFVTGNRVWSVPRLDADRVYVTSMDHFVYAIDRKTGTQVWKHDLGASAPGSLTLANGRLYVGSIERHLICLNAEDGTEIWRSPQYGGWVWGEALVVDDGVYFGSLDGMMHALSVADGTPLWPDVQLQGAVRAGPALAGDQLIVGTEAGYVYTMSIANGDKALVFGDRDNEKMGAVLSTPVVADSEIFVSTTQAKVVALDLSKRDPVEWVYPPAEQK